jgi:hypothetical protein
MNYTAFMRFWAAANAILKSHGKPEMKFGEAKDYWKETAGLV